jgi:hypothetical protein
MGFPVFDASLAKEPVALPAGTRLIKKLEAY